MSPDGEVLYAIPVTCQPCGAVFITAAETGWVTCPRCGCIAYLTVTLEADEEEE